jgi:hypothetical protein
MWWPPMVVFASGGDWLATTRRIHAGIPINKLDESLMPLDLGYDVDVVSYPGRPCRRGERMRRLTPVRPSGWREFLPVPTRWRSAR